MAYQAKCRYRISISRRKYERLRLWRLKNAAEGEAESGWRLRGSGGILSTVAASLTAAAAIRKSKKRKLARRNILYREESQRMSSAALYEEKA
jgi:hypothetical protein